jgi:hypothetical protein
VTLPFKAGRGRDLYEKSNRDSVGLIKLGWILGCIVFIGTRSGRLICISVVQKKRHRERICWAANQNGSMQVPSHKESDHCSVDLCSPLNAQLRPNSVCML